MAWQVLHPTMPTTFCVTTWGGFEPNVPLLQRLALRATAPLLKQFMRGAFRLNHPRPVGDLIYFLIGRLFSSLRLQCGLQQRAVFVYLRRRAEEYLGRRKARLLAVCDEVDAALDRSGGRFICGPEMTYVAARSLPPKRRTLCFAAEKVAPWPCGPVIHQQLRTSPVHPLPQRRRELRTALDNGRASEANFRTGSLLLYHQCPLVRRRFVSGTSISPSRRCCTF